MERKNPVNLRASDAYLEQTGEEEGFVGYAYDDADPKPIKTFITDENTHLIQGTLTIGHGHTRTVKPGMKATREEARALLRSDIRDAESCVHRYVRVPLTQGEFDGMVDLFFNVGPGSMPNEHYPKGKDGIYCLGKSGNGRQSTLLTILNNAMPDGSNYARAAECFTQWRMPGSIFEWGLLKRRIRFMLFFLGLPLRRAVNAFPSAPPINDSARYDLVKRCVALASEEKADEDGLKPDTLDLKPTQIIPPAVSRANDETKADGASLSSQPASAPSAQPNPARVSPGAEPQALPSTPSPPVPPNRPSQGQGLPGATVAPAPKPAPVPPVVAKPPPKLPPVIAPKQINIDAIPYGQIAAENGAKNMTDSKRGLGMVIVGLGSVVQILAGREIVSSTVGAVFFDMSRDPVLVALVVGAVFMVVGWVTRKRGTKIMTDGMKNATQVLK